MTLWLRSCQSLPVEGMSENGQARAVDGHPGRDLAEPLEGANTYVPTPCKEKEKAYIALIQHLTAPPRVFVRPGPFLSSPGHGPIQRNGLNVWWGICRSRAGLQWAACLDACPERRE